MKKGILIAACVIAGILFTGCGKKSTDEVFDAYLKTIDDTYSYAKVDLAPDTKVLLVAEVGTYDDGGKQVTIAATVYCDVKGKVTKVGEIECGGTAYPIRTDGTYLYEAGNHFATKYSVDMTNHTLYAKDNIKVDYDACTGDASYYRCLDGKDTRTTEEEYNNFFAEWENSESIAFELVGVLK